MNSKENDQLRQSIPFISRPNLLVVTRGINSLPVQDQVEIMERVRDFNDFTPDNDPYSQHDFGSFMHNGEKIFWKIDDYAGNEGYNLVLTILFADEY